LTVTIVAQPEPAGIIDAGNIVGVDDAWHTHYLDVLEALADAYDALAQRNQQVEDLLADPLVVNYSLWWSVPWRVSELERLADWCDFLLCGAGVPPLKRPWRKLIQRASAGRDWRGPARKTAKARKRGGRVFLPRVEVAL
jgi:hypothetical protein